MTRTDGKRAETMRRVLRIAAMILVTYLAYLGVVYALQDRMVFPGADRAAPQWTDREGIELWSRAVDGVEVEAIFAPSPDASAEQAAPLVVFFHGNGGLIDDSLGRIPAYHRLGFNVLMPEYRGYGRSDGEPSEAAIVDDATYFVERATARPDVDGDRVLYHGQSLGGGVAAAVARRRAPDAMIMESTFTSVRDFAADLGAPGFLSKHPFDTASFLKSYDGPVLLMHAVDDPVVPYEMGARLAETGRRIQFETYQGRAHMLPPRAESERYRSLIDRFVHEHALVALEEAHRDGLLK